MNERGAVHWIVLTGIGMVASILLNTLPDKSDPRKVEWAKNAAVQCVSRCEKRGWIAEFEVNTWQCRCRRPDAVSD